MPDSNYTSPSVFRLHTHLERAISHRIDGEWNRYVKSQVSICLACWMPPILWTYPLDPGSISLFPLFANRYQHSKNNLTIQQRLIMALKIKSLWNESYINKPCRRFRWPVRPDCSILPGPWILVLSKARYLVVSFLSLIEHDEHHSYKFPHGWDMSEASWSLSLLYRNIIFLMWWSCILF